MVISILLTCHNRKNKTLRCLRSLKEQVNPNEEYSCFVYLVDDGSTDGTTPAICQKFPDVNIIQGTGCLYWYGGMQLAWEHALK
ncbi:MAG: glycosyltransferase, partial [Epsilonproteobacteria bacterium]|nr:glycosyltransferase [Campylobacterota bacterium]